MSPKTYSELTPIKVKSSTLLELADEDLVHLNGKMVNYEDVVLNLSFTEETDRDDCSVRCIQIRATSPIKISKNHEHTVNSVPDSQKDHICHAEGSLDQTNYEQISRESHQSNGSASPKQKKRKRNAATRLSEEKCKYILRPPCKENCIRKCVSKFSEDDRKIIWSNFRDLTIQNQRNFISRSVKKQAKVTSSTASSNSRRHNTLIWTLRDIRVCKTFFLNTLGFFNDQTVITILKANYKHGVDDPDIQPAAREQRGTSKPWNAFSEEYKTAVIEFIERVKPTVSHYNLKHAPNRKYLPCGISFYDLYREFGTHCQENNIKSCSWPFFFKIIKKLNLSTAMPKQDLCTLCHNHKERHGTDTEHICSECECEMCKKYIIHYVNKTLSRKLLDEDEKSQNESKRVFTADMQKAICMPKLTIKDYYFSRKLVLFNETFASPGKDKQAICVLWHEGESGRKAYNVASAFVNFIISYGRDLNEIVFFCDNCSAQNKNRILFSALVRLINSSALITTNIIRFVYFEPGHTTMAADTVHGSITRKFTQKKVMYDFLDYIDKIKQSRKNLDILTLTHKDMTLYKDEIRKNTFPKNYNVQALKIVEFRKGSFSIFVKNAYDEKEYKELTAFPKSVLDSFANKNDHISDLPRETCSRGVSSGKKKNFSNSATPCHRLAESSFRNFVRKKIPLIWTKLLIIRLD